MHAWPRCQEGAFREYYTVFADAYRENLEQAGATGQIREGDYEVWAWALIGRNVFLGMRFAAWDGSRSSEETAAAVASLISTGMSLPTRNDLPASKATSTILVR